MDLLFTLTFDLEFEFDVYFFLRLGVLSGFHLSPHPAIPSQHLRVAEPTDPL
jgi:hypothetical protein